VGTKFSVRIPIFLGCANPIVQLRVHGRLERTHLSTRSLQRPVISYKMESFRASRTSWRYNYAAGLLETEALEFCTIFGEQKEEECVIQYKMCTLENTCILDGPSSEVCLEHTRQWRRLVGGRRVLAQPVEVLVLRERHLCRAARQLYHYDPLYIIMAQP
jgi:hypothetical protein